MTSENNDESRKPPRGLFWVTACITICWLVGTFTLAYGNFEAFEHPTKLNEWGDFAAGAFAPLAFLWLVVAVVLQSTELREQREELRLTRLEFEHNREVLKAQADEARKQAQFIGMQTKLLEEQNLAQQRAEKLREFDDLVAALPAAITKEILYETLLYGTSDNTAFSPEGSMHSEAIGYSDPVAVAKIAGEAWIGRMTKRKISYHMVPRLRDNVLNVSRIVARALELQAQLEWRRDAEARHLQLQELSAVFSWMLSLEDVPEGSKGYP